MLFRSRDIAARAGMSPAAVYVHHDTKESLLFTVSIDGHRSALQVVESADDPAAAYDRNPNRIAPWALTMTMPAAPGAAATPTCLSLASIGVARNGVAFYASIDERNRDAVAYETQDVCDGHPQQAGQYHYHAVPSCLLNASKGASTVVGFARDGFPIVVERNAAGELPTNADLDECHGRTSPVLLDGEVVTTYHYSATYEFP